MAVRRNEQSAKATVRWAVRVAADSLERLAELARGTNMSPGQILAMAFESLASEKDSELRRYVVARAEVPRAVGAWRAWKFDVPAVTVVHVESVATELRVAKQVLVTLVIDCLTQGQGDGGKRSSLEELLRIIYSSVTPPAAGGLSSAEVVATSTA